MNLFRSDETKESVEKRKDLQVDKLQSLKKYKINFWLRFGLANVINDY